MAAPFVYGQTLSDCRMNKSPFEYVNDDDDGSSTHTCSRPMEYGYNYNYMYSWCMGMNGCNSSINGEDTCH